MFCGAGLLERTGSLDSNYSYNIVSKCKSRLCVSIHIDHPLGYVSTLNLQVCFKLTIQKCSSKTFIYACLKERCLVNNFLLNLVNFSLEEQIDTAALGW